VGCGEPSALLPLLRLRLALVVPGPDETFDTLDDDEGGLIYHDAPDGRA
jgi:hypothetical protein